MKPDQLPPQSDPLMRLLDTWQEQPELSAGFDQRLGRRIAAAEAAPRPFWQRWLPSLEPRLAWSGAVATIVAVVAVSVFLVYGNNRSEPASATPSFQTAQMDGVVRDLQTLQRDGDLLDNLDFLSAPSPAAAPKIQDRRD